MKKIKDPLRFSAADIKAMREREKARGRNVKYKGIRIK